ncbi:MAG: 5-(carboxyamino)imidazole ribonucleotide synthase [Planctomycetota bacterium]
MQDSKTLRPGATIGMVGSGQLGRMFAIAAATMGYRVVVLAGDKNDPASQVATEVIEGQLTDRNAVRRFAEQCDVITLEFENIPSETIQWCAESAPTYPSSLVLETAQDRLIEKSTLRDAGLPLAPFAEVDSAESVAHFASEHGWPVIVKTARSGYDGKGQHRLKNVDEASHVDWAAAGRWVAEKFIEFEREASVIVARSSRGEVRCFETIENRHRNHILDVSIVPADLTPAQRQRAEGIALATAEHLSLVGLICVELFVLGDSLLVNEIAPRPHNSGHLTIEACHTSQFEQHVRAVCGLPLGNPSRQVPAAAMANLLGDAWSDGTPRWEHCLSEPGLELHLYGKANAKPGRKMGHLTTTGSDVREVVARVERGRDRLGQKG